MEGGCAAVDALLERDLRGKSAFLLSLDLINEATLGLLGNVGSALSRFGQGRLHSTLTTKAV